MSVWISRRGHKLGFVVRSWRSEIFYFPYFVLTLIFYFELIISIYIWLSTHRRSCIVDTNSRGLHHYDGSLLALVQLWDSRVFIGSSSTIILPICPSNKASLITRDSSDLFPSHREILFRQSMHLILRGPYKDDASLSTKGDQLQLTVASKSKKLTGKATYVNNGVKSPLQTPKAANVTDFEVINVNKSVEKSLAITPFCSNASKTYMSLHEDGISTSATSSSNEISVSLEQH
ncbi:hypothetical protein R3W88_000952 [Solanum pinnatisectum]|uniref:Uncharacterized protein n=1 Tax=Solanum pinnatisectum TaxID=50273 RepID=A0AAV9MK77_9SOLN|nr:hypothetical protein R3W88_000952 [Solanum pinnatisectum]